MFGFMQRFGRNSRASSRGTGPVNRVRRRNHQLNCEALESRQLLAGFYIINDQSGKVLDDPGASSSNGAHIDQWQLNGGTNQRWDLVPMGNGNYAIENEASLQFSAIRIPTAMIRRNTDRVGEMTASCSKPVVVSTSPVSRDRMPPVFMSHSFGNGRCRKRSRSDRRSASVI